MAKTEKVGTNIKDKVEYLGLNFKRVPKALIATDNPEFKILKGYDEKQYKQYKFIKIKDIDILLTPTHRLDNLKEKYDLASPLYMYLDSEQEENAQKYATFLKMLKKIQISDVDKVAKEQEMLSKKLPFKVKFNGNYLWQIYYSENTGRYFMLVPTEDPDYSTFFYLLKKKIENKKDDSNFVPISYLDYSETILSKSELKDIENYLWLFTKDYPSIYEVTDKDGKESLQIVGETRVYGKIKTIYKMKYESKKEASKFYKLLKAIFILQVELPHYYNFETNIGEDGELGIYLDGKEVKYENLLEFVSGQYAKSVKLKEQTNKDIINLNEKLVILRRESTKLEKEYLEKEKMISTFLECKKSFFGKVKYYFKFGGNKKLKKVKNKEEEAKTEENKDKEKSKSIDTKIKTKNYTLEELIMSYKDLETIENSKKNIVQDINAIKLKNKNLKKKIENATSYINEINKHKKSIFEFWKYSNKDEVAALEEGEEEEINVSKIEKTFNYDNDFVEFGEKIDKSQRLKFTDSELDSCYIASTELLDVMNNMYDKVTAELSDFSKTLKKLKDEKNVFDEEENQDFDIFGGFYEDGQKERLLGNKTHRETPRNKFEILEIKKDMKEEDLRRSISEVNKNIQKALKKNSLDEDLYAYRASEKELKFDGFQLFSLNEEQELKKYYNDENINSKVYLYRLKLNRGTNFVALSNIVFYNNKNMTLPVGMQESDEILVDINSLNLGKPEHRKINVKKLENEKDDFSDAVLKVLEITELESKT